MKTILGIVITAFLFLCAPVSAQTVNHGIPWDTLQKLKGKYAGDKPNAAVLNPPLKKLLGGKYKEFDNYFQVQSPMALGNDLLLANGMQAHSGGENAAFAVFGKNGQLLVAIKRDKKKEYIGSTELLNDTAVIELLKTYD